MFKIVASILGALAVVSACVGQYVLAVLFALGIGVAYLVSVFKIKSEIENTQKKIKEIEQAKKQGIQTKPFIDVNKAPLHILEQLPGTDSESIKNALQLKEQNGPFPSINVFIHLLKVKPIFGNVIRDVAYCDPEMPSVEQIEAEKRAKVEELERQIEEKKASKE